MILLLMERSYTAHKMLVLFTQTNVSMDSTSIMSCKKALEKFLEKAKVIFFYSFNGCDTSSSFSSIGKKMALNICSSFS